MHTAEAFGERFHPEFLRLFEEAPWHRRWLRVLHGLRQPRDSGEYRFARLQLLRLSAPLAAVLVPALAVLAVVVLAATGPEDPPASWVVTRVVRPEPPPPEPAPEPPRFVPPTLVAALPDPVAGMAEPSLREPVVADAGPAPDPLPPQFVPVRHAPSPVMIKSVYSRRSGPDRDRALDDGGGGPWTEGAVLRALRWLKKNQNPDGSWSDCKPAMTGLALLTFLAHGETPGSVEFGATVHKGLQYLAESQDASGHFQGRDAHDYAQPIAAYALCEAYGLTRIPMLRDAAARAVAEIVRGQNPNGAFNYNLDASPARHDTSYMGWCAQALKAADMARLEVPGLREAMLRAVQGFANNYVGDAARGEFAYTGRPALARGTGGLTGVGVLCMQLLGAAGARECRGGLAALRDSTYRWEGGGTYNQVYYWYYTTQAMFHEGGDTWKRWNDLFAPVLVKNQVVIAGGIEGPDGRATDIGYWAPPAEVSGHTDREGKVMNTCLCALQLEVYYRYLLTGAPDAGADEADAAGPDDDLVRVSDG